MGHMKKYEGTSSRRGSSRRATESVVARLVYVKYVHTNKQTNSQFALKSQPLQIVDKNFYLKLFVCFEMKNRPNNK